MDTLLTLAGHVPADIQLRALSMADECALPVLFGRSWRTDGQRAGFGEPAAFVGEIGLTSRGRVVVRVPSRGPLCDLVGGVLRVAWPAEALREYQAELDRAGARFRAAAAAGCRGGRAADMTCSSG